MEKDASDYIGRNDLLQGKCTTIGSNSQCEPAQTRKRLGSTTYCATAKKKDGKDECLNNNLPGERSFLKPGSDTAANPELAVPPDQPAYMMKRIGSTTYKVAVHFSPDAKETASDKIALLIRNERLVGE